MEMLELSNERRTVFDWTSEEMHEFLKQVPVVEPEQDELEAMEEAHLYIDDRISHKMLINTLNL